MILLFVSHVCINLYTYHQMQCDKHHNHASCRLNNFQSIFHHLSIYKHLSHVFYLISINLHMNHHVSILIFLFLIACLQNTFLHKYNLLLVSHFCPYHVTNLLSIILSKHHHFRNNSIQIHATDFE